MKKRAFYLYFIVILSSVMFAGCKWLCDHPDDTDTASYMLSRADVNLARMGGNGLKIVDVGREGEIPNEFLVIPVDGGGATMGATAFKGVKRCPPACLGDGAPATAGAGLEAHPITEYPAERVRADRGIVIPAGVLNTIMDSCANYLGISSEPGTGQIMLTAISNTANPCARGTVTYP